MHFSVRAVGFLLVGCALLTPVSVATAETLGQLFAQYQAAKAKVGGTPDQRRDKANKGVAPIVRKIAAVDSDEAAAFLAREMNDAVPEIGAFCAQSLVRMKNERGLSLAMRGLGKRHATVVSAVLEALATIDRKRLESSEPALLQFASSARAPDVRRRLPPVIVRLESAAAAGVLLKGVGAGSKSGEYNRAVAAALGSSKSAEIREWLLNAAFASAAKSPAKLEVLCSVAGKQKLTDARADLEECVRNRSADVSAAALDALVAIGVDASVDAISAALAKRKGKKHFDFRVAALDALAASGSDRAAKLIAEYLDDRDEETRAVAAGSLGVMKANEAAVAALARGLGDKSAMVRNSALNAMRTIRNKQLVGPLIAYLGGKDDESRKVKALQALINITHQNMGLVAADWEKWWKFAEKSFELPKGEKAFTSVKAYDLSYFGIEVSSTRMTFIVDISSSMKQAVPVQTKSSKKSVPKIDVLKKELERVVSKLPADAQINIVKFDANFRSWQKKLQPLAGRGRKKAVDYIRSITTGAGTNVYDSLESALKDQRVDTIYLLTDGNPTRGRYQATPDILREIRKINRVRSATIHCIAFGAESDLLKQLAKQNGGKYRFVDKMAN